jgi:hypothetical protein
MSGGSTLEKMKIFTETGKMLHHSGVGCESRAPHISDPYILKENNVV